MMASSRVVVVTGASRGIGAAIARTLAMGGDRVFALSRTGANPVPGSSHVRALPCDVSDASQVQSALIGRDRVHRSYRRARQQRRNN